MTYNSTPNVPSQRQTYHLNAKRAISTPNVPSQRQTYHLNAKRTISTPNVPSQRQTYHRQLLMFYQLNLSAQYLGYLYIVVYSEQVHRLSLNSQAAELQMLKYARKQHKLDTLVPFSCNMFGSVPKH